MPSPPQGYTVVLPGEITQSDLDPQQPPAKLSSYPLTIGKDIPGPNESNYVANDNTGNLLNIVNSDTSSTTLSALKMAIDAITLIRTNGELAINLANGNSWSALQSFTEGISFTSSPSNGRTMDLTTLSANSPYTDIELNLHFPNGTSGTRWIIYDASGDPTFVIYPITGQVNTIKNELDDGSGNMSVSGNLATTSLNLNGSGDISALVSSFNGRTGAVVPASGDYSHHAVINNEEATPYASGSSTQIGTIKTGPNGIVFWCGSCVTETASSGNIIISIGSATTTNSSIGASTTTGSTWSVNGFEPYYPVILTGITDASNGSLEPNTSYPIYLNNTSGASITVLDLNAAVIGL
jgi:hypothetical protein